MALRAVLGFIGANVLLTVAGAGVLMALGLVRPRPRDLLAAGGLAFLCGISVVMLVGYVGLVAGIPIRFSTYAAFCLVISAGGLALALRRRVIENALDAAPGWGMRTTRLELLLGLGALAALGLMFAVSARYYAVLPVDAWDEFAMWSKKALFLFYHDTLDPRFFAGAAYDMHKEYPILLPLLEAFIYRGMGSAATSPMHLEFLLLFVAFLWAVALLARQRGPFRSWAPLLLGLSVSPWVFDQLYTGYADLPVTFLLGTGALCVGLWLERPRPAQLVLATLLLGAAANTKMEGLVAGAIVLSLAVVLSLAGSQTRRAAHAGLALVGLVATVLPWRLWTAVHDVHVYLDIRKGLDPSFLWESRENALAAVTIMSDQLANQSRLSFIVPAALALIVLCLVTGIQRQLASFYLVGGLLQASFLIWVYWVEPSSWSPLRTIDTVVIFAMLAFLHLGMALWPDSVSTHERTAPIGVPPPGRDRRPLPLQRSTATRD